MCGSPGFKKLKKEKRKTRNNRGTEQRLGKVRGVNSCNFAKVGGVGEGDFELRSEGGEGTSQADGRNKSQE